MSVTTRPPIATLVADNAPFTPEQREWLNGFFAGLVDHRELYTAFLNIHNMLRGIALGEDGFLSSKFVHGSPQTGGVEK